MYISELKIHGFKSFIKSEVLEFGEGITAIVGPNGCGKTNIVDAIRWVLGEQKYSVLRSGRMEDVIFNGAKGFKPLSVCEVFLTVHNDKGRLPIEYTDVEIGRRIYRNGESEYFLNKTLCRLKDIQDLFVDTGMGADAYSVIELKMIEQILSETAGERKHMFEEAAGINKYKSQRKSALRKFEATKHDLNRITDIINEVDVKVRGLALQMKRYKRYENLQNDLRENEIILAATKIKQLKQKIDPIAAEITSFQNSKSINVSDETEFDTNLVKLREEYHLQEQDIKVQRNKIDSLEEDRAAKHQLIIVSKEQNRSDNNSIERLKNETSDLVEKQLSLQKKIDEFHAELKLIEPLLKEQSDKYNYLKGKFEEADKQFGASESLVNSMQNQRWELQKKLTDKRSIILKTETLIEDKELQKEKTDQKLNSLKLKLKQTLAENSGIASKRTKYIEEVKSLENDLAEIEKKLTSARLKLENDQKQLNSMLNSEESLESRLNFFRNLIVSMDDHPRGVKYILNNKDKFDDVLGTISEILKTEKKYAVAIEAALGDLTYCLVTENRKTALNLLETANRKKIGQLSVIPLSDLNTKATVIRTVPIHPQIVDLAANLVQTESKVKLLADSLLNNVLVVKNLSESLKDKSLDSWNLVDLNGNCSNLRRVLRNSVKSSDDLALGRADKIEAINGELELTKTGIAALKKQITTDHSLLRTHEQEQARLEHALQVVNSKLKSSETDELRFNLEKSQLEESIQETEISLTELNNAKQHQKKALELLLEMLNYI
jgi:chromosome segregation protein